MRLRTARMCQHSFAVATPLLVYKILKSIFRPTIGVNRFSLLGWDPFWDVLAHCKCLDWLYISRYCANKHNAWSKPIQIVLLYLCCWKSRNETLPHFPTSFKRPILGNLAWIHCFLVCVSEYFKDTGLAANFWRLQCKSMSQLCGQAKVRFVDSNLSLDSLKVNVFQHMLTGYNFLVSMGFQRPKKYLRAATLGSVE